MRSLVLLPVALVLSGLAAATQAFPSVDIKIDQDARRCYTRMGPKKGAKRGRRGYGLLILIPSGNNGAYDITECEQVYRRCCNKTYLAARVHSPANDDGVVWPIHRPRTAARGVCSVRLVEQVIEDVRSWKKVDPRRIFVVAWFLGGHVAYTVSLQKKKSPTGFFIGMGEFRHQSISAPAGGAYYILHSPDDEVTPFETAQRAQQLLTGAGAKVTLATYRGPHVWYSLIDRRIKKGIQWLEKNHAAPPKPAPP